MANELRFSTVRTLLESNGWVLTRTHGSHHVFTKPGRWPISLPVHRGKVKAIYVRKVQEIIEEQEGVEGQD